MQNPVDVLYWDFRGLQYDSAVGNPKRDVFTLPDEIECNRGAVSIRDEQDQSIAPVSGITSCLLLKHG